MLAARQRRPPPEIFEPGAAGDAARKEYGAWYTETDAAEWYTLGIHLGYRYDDSPIVLAGRHAGAAAREAATYTPDRAAGRRARRTPGSPDGRSTLDLFGRGFMLLRLGADAPDAGALRAAAAAAGVPLHVVELDAPDIAALYERRLVLVRPDGHVAWRADARAGGRARGDRRRARRAAAAANIDAERCGVLDGCHCEPSAW